MKADISLAQTVTGGSEPELDPRLAEILESYLAALERGAAPERDEFLVQHPEHAANLEKYLPWVELLYETKPRDGSAPANPPMPSRLGDFRLFEEIGRGGMGIVYEAEQLSLKRRVALKVLPFASMLDSRQLQRFKNEALAAAHLNHPHIVPVYAVGCELGLHFFAMQLIKGESIEQLIERSRVNDETQVQQGTAPAAPVTQSVAARDRFRQFALWFVQAAEALEHAHQQGIVHRDIKPSNLMISNSGELWVADFGLARMQRDHSMTATGEILGTWRYMSPEQLRSKPGIVDHRTDIYSLGLTLYELVAGRPAFDAATHEALVRQIEQDDPPTLSRLEPSVPRDLESIVSKATHKTPGNRYDSAQDMADDLVRFLEGRPTVARPASLRDRGEKWVRRHARLAAAGGIVLLLAMFCVVVSSILIWRANAETKRALVLAETNHHRAEENLRDARWAVDDVFTGVAAQLAEIPRAENVRHRLLHQALSYYQKFAERSGDNPQVRAETAAAFYRCGQIEEQLGDADAAAAAYTEARRVWTELEVDNCSAETLRSLALCENNLGLIHLRAGRIADAEGHLRQAVERMKSVDAEHANTESNTMLALAHANLGSALGQGGKLTAAKEQLQTALALQTESPPQSTAARGDLASTYNQLGYLFSTSSLAEAEAAYRRSAEILQQLFREEPHVLGWQAQWATALGNLASLEAAAGRLNEAEADYCQAVALHQQISNQAPSRVAYLRDLAISQNNFAYLLSKKRRPADAIEQLQKARTNLLQLCQIHGNLPEYVSRLGAVCNNLGLAWEERGKPDEAKAAFHEAIEWQERAVALSPNWPEAQNYLEAHRRNLRRLEATSFLAIEPNDAKPWIVERHESPERVSNQP